MLHFSFPQGWSWLIEESKTLKGGMAVNPQSHIRIALASAPNIVAETPEEDAAFRCGHQRGIMDNGFCAPSKNERIWSASGEFRGHLGFLTSTA